MIEIPTVDDEQLPQNTEQLLNSTDPTKVALAVTAVK